MKNNTPKFGLAALVSQPTPDVSPSSVDALLFTAAGSVPTNTVSTPAPRAPLAKTRFTNTLPTATYVQLHQLAFWSRQEMGAIVNAALQDYFATRPGANRSLPEVERLKRRLPPT